MGTDRRESVARAEDVPIGVARFGPDFVTLDAYRAFVDEIVGRRNANLAKRDRAREGSTGDAAERPHD